jgi:hypothetical protein
MLLPAFFIVVADLAGDPSEFARKLLAIKEDT